MTGPADLQLLTTRQVATFVRDGLLVLDGVVDADLNHAAMDEMAARRRGEHPGPRPATGTPLSACYPAPSAIGRVLRHPVVAGAIQSLLGPDPAFDHDFTHLLPAGWPDAQELHVDARQDSDGPAFDIQLFYYPHDVGPDGGGTRFVPGSHLRRVHAGHVGRYQHVVGEHHHTGAAGSIVIAHHGIWHAGRPNPSDRPRVMHKVRLNPTVPQVRHWDLRDLDALHNDPADHVFATFGDDTVATLLRHRHPWMTVAAGRIETVRRALLWRHLTGDAHYDVDHYLTRIERRDAIDEAR